MHQLTFSAEGGPASRFLNQIPRINAVAGFHDMVMTSLEEPWRTIFKVPTMPPTAVIAGAGLVNGYAATRLFDRYRTN